VSAYDSGAFGSGGIGALASVSIDLYTTAYRVSGSIETRFGRVTEILNQLSGGHLTVLQAMITEHADPGSTLATPSALVAVDEILFMVATDLTGTSNEMRIPKRPVRAQLAIPPFRITGTIHVPMGSRPVDGLLHGVDQFVAMTDATLASAPHPHLDRTAPVMALRRGGAQVLLVADDETPDVLLAEVLDERTAEAWLGTEEDAS
jgi:hypothetical protein